jgi:monoamine oxidase
MRKYETIIIGAGASGLTVASRLSRMRKDILILEARDRLGGRIYTFTDDDFKIPVELGAEFIHGELPVTMAMLKEYGIEYFHVKGDVIQIRQGEPERDKDFVPEHHRLLEKKLKSLEKDISLQDFLDKNFPGDEYKALREGVIGFTEGFESADVSRFSTFAFRKDWEEAEEWEQYRIEGGYGALINAMEKEYRANGGTIQHSTSVKEIHWKKNEVHVVCEGQKIFFAKHVVITVPLGVLQAEKILFFPPLPEKTAAAKKLGFGDVIKILLLFKEKFWEEKQTEERMGKNLEKLFFLFSKAPVPTWWTQVPKQEALLTGWLSGSKAKLSMLQSDEQIFEDALKSLSIIFKTDEKAVHEKLAAWKVVNWCKDPFTLGSYAYATVDADKYAQMLEAPVEQCIFFSGEIFSPERGGMVEDALVSGLNTVEKILAVDQPAGIQ